MKIRNKQNSSVRRPAYTKWAFTLVELIVVITILAILWTIAFISLQWYSSQARDSKRLSDISNIKKSVELFSLNTWKYPEPDDSITMSYSWEVLRYQWTVWDQVATNVSRNLNEKPLDPSTGLEYIYSTTHSQTEYEVLGLYESDLIWTSPQPSPLRGEGARTLFFSSTNAETQDYAKIDGNYNWIYMKTSSFYIPTPSIINAEIVSHDDLDDNLIKSQIITWWNNLPLVSTWGLNVNFAYYEWTITSNSTDTAKMALVEAIQSAYSWSDLASDTMYADLLSRTSTWEMVDFVDVVVLGSVEYRSSDTNNIVLFKNCKEILDNDLNSSDWIYTIDPEENWIWFEVYCDMTTDWWGWTLVATMSKDVTSSIVTTDAIWWTPTPAKSISKLSDVNINAINNLSSEINSYKLTCWYWESIWTRYFRKTCNFDMSSHAISDCAWWTETSETINYYWSWDSWYMYWLTANFTWSNSQKVVFFFNHPTYLNCLWPVDSTYPNNTWTLYIR